MKLIRLDVPVSRRVLRHLKDLLTRSLAARLRSRRSQERTRP